MADRPSTATMRRRMYVPEERPDYEAYIADPENQRIAQDAALNLAGLAMGPIGEIPAGIRLAKNLYSGYRGLEKLTPRADRGNAMRPEEMLQVEGPPAQKALPSPKRPPMSEEELQAMEIARMVGEGGPSASKQAAVRRETNRRPTEEEIRANEISRMEGEGGLDPQTAALIRSIKEDRERAAHAEDLARFEGEGGGAWTYTGPRYKYGLPATQGPREAISYGNSNTLPTLAGGRGGGDLISPTLKFYKEEPPIALPPPNGPRFAGSQSADGGPSTGGFSNFQTNIPYNVQGPSILKAALPVTFGASMLPGIGARMPNSGMAPAEVQNSVTTPTELPVSPPLAYIKPDDVEIQYGIQGRAPVAGVSNSSIGSKGSAAPSKAQTEAKGPDVRALWEKYNQSQSPGDYVRADRAMMDAIKNKQDIGYYGQKLEGEKRGGAVEKKPDAIHKALEIIHHLISR